MKLAIALLIAFVHVSYAHVRLTFPPARQPDYDFLDNVRTGGPCGVPGKLQNTAGSIYYSCIAISS